MTHAVRLSIVYIACGADGEPFAWRGGAPAEAVAVHRELSELVAGAGVDQRVPGGRLARSGDRWLAEVDLGPIGENGHRLTAVLLADAAGPPGRGPGRSPRGRPRSSRAPASPSNRRRSAAY